MSLVAIRRLSVCSLEARAGPLFAAIKNIVCSLWARAGNIPEVIDQSRESCQPQWLSVCSL